MGQNQSPIGFQYGPSQLTSRERDPPPAHESNWSAAGPGRWWRHSPAGACTSCEGGTSVAAVASTAAVATRSPLTHGIVLVFVSVVMVFVSVMVTVSMFLLFHQIGHRNRRVGGELQNHNLEPLAAADVEGAGSSDGTD